MAHYVGTRSKRGCEVHFVGECGTRPLRPRLDVVNHSPTGFEWGYGGSGPAQLALALLMDVMGDRQFALAHYHDFKFSIIARLPRVGWKLPLDQIIAWCCAQAEAWTEDPDALNHRGRGEPQIQGAKRWPRKRARGERPCG